MTFVSILYMILAILGLSFLIFIHELGHYYMARRLGMRVETFSIGFGKPIYSWIRDGVKWQIGWLLFGGYVKIAGTDTEGKTNPFDIKDGFFGKSPLDRIKVAIMGPLVNIFFALLIFTVLFAIGGRVKNFSEYTQKIGWIDPKSELYAKGVRPGDEIVSYNDRQYEGAKDHVSAPMMAHGEVEVRGFKVDPYTKRKVAFDYKVKPYAHPSAFNKEILTAGIIQPASYLTYDQANSAKAIALPEGSPMLTSGIQPGDRLVWADGVPLYSLQQLSYLLTEAKALLTIERGGDFILRRVPRVHTEELKLNQETKAELSDWQFEANLKGVKFPKLYYIPYNLNHEAVVESPIKFIDQEKEEELFSKHPYTPLDQPLQEGDRIIAVDGSLVSHSFEILLRLQQHAVNLIVQRDATRPTLPSSETADALFDAQYKWEDLHHLISQIGFDTPPRSSGNLVLLSPVTAKMRKDFPLSKEGQARLKEEMEEQKREIDSIEDPQKRALARQLLAARDEQLLLGLPAIQDQKVLYNPSPIALFYKVFEEIAHTLQALFGGSLNPKWMSGPIGIVQVVHDHSMVSLKEALFWLGAISLNLGVLNLLPLPVLDGGTICFSLYELITKRRLQPKTMEKLIIPFAILLITFFIFLTYHDILRIFTR